MDKDKAKAADAPQGLVARIKRARVDGLEPEKQAKPASHVEDKWEMIKAKLIEHAGKTKESELNWFDYEVAPEELTEEEAKEIEQFAHQEGLGTGFVIKAKVACKNSDCYVWCHCPRRLVHMLQLRWK